MQLTLNLFGYGALIRFWVTAQSIETALSSGWTCCWLSEGRWFALEHILFSTSILLCYFYEVQFCRDVLTTLEVIETQLEFFLLGYLSSLIKI